MWLPYASWFGDFSGSVSFSPLPQKTLPVSEPTETPPRMAASIYLNTTRAPGCPSLGTRGGRWVRKDCLATDHSVLSPGPWGVWCSPRQAGRTLPPNHCCLLGGAQLGEDWSLLCWSLSLSATWGSPTHRPREAAGADMSGELWGSISGFESCQG